MVRPTDLRMSVVNRNKAKNHAKAFYDTVDAETWETTGDIFEKDAIVLPGKERGQQVTFSELAVITHFLNEVENKFVVSDRDIELKGLRRNYEQIVGWIANFKKNEVSGSADIKPVWDADDTDIALDVLRPQYVGKDNWEFEGLTQGSEDIIDISLESGMEVFFTGDIIELNSNALLTAMQYASLDGEAYRATEFYLQTRATDLQYSVVPGGSAKSSIDYKAYAHDAGDTEFVPLAIVVAEGDVVSEGTKIGTLTS